MRSSYPSCRDYEQDFESDVDKEAVPHDPSGAVQIGGRSLLHD